jgi:hypothetical protein
MTNQFPDATKMVFPPNDLSHLSDEEFNALAPQGYHATGPAEPLSPAAQAVLIAEAKSRCLREERGCHPNDSDWNGCWVCVHRRGLVAALRAAADQASPKLHIKDIDYLPQSYVDGWNDSLELILDIAAELDNPSQPS